MDAFTNMRSLTCLLARLTVYLVFLVFLIYKTKDILNPNYLSHVVA